MIQITPQMRILLAVEPVDFRRGADSLAALVRELCRRGGLSDTDIDVSPSAAAVPGYTIEAIASAPASTRCRAGRAARAPRSARPRP